MLTIIIAPTSKLIIQNIEVVYVAMVKICEAEGALVSGLAERSGRGSEEDGSGRMNVDVACGGGGHQQVYNG